MDVLFHKNFKRYYKKLQPGERKKCDERTALFMKEPRHPVLDNHPLGGKYKGYRSINITGDLRVLYEPVAGSISLFIIVDTHSNLYS